MAVSCDLTSGWENVGYIVSRDDVDFASIVKGYTASGDGTSYPNTVVTQFALKDSKKGKYIAQLKNAFADTAVSLNAGDYKNTVTSTVSFKVFGSSPEIAKTMNALLNGEYVVILQSKYKGANGEAAYHIFGLSQGLEISALDQTISDDGFPGFSVSLEETAGDSAQYFLFVSADGTSEPTLAATEACLASAFETVE